MHNTILNYTLNLVERQTILIPIGAKIITAQSLGDKVGLCAMVDTMNKGENRTISIVGTGKALPKINPDEKLVYIDTVQQYGLLWHVFEIVQKQIA
jgi:hypothetical protein